MWGYISTEASYQLNFNVGFSTTRSDVLVHLAQWQYWWWFWFAFLWSFYYLLSTRVVRYRTLKMHPKIMTSFRPHGKWGDFLAAIVPAIWCLNILSNSNFILRLMEWQNESSLFTVRVRARQWYWIYKFELKNFTDIITVPKNVGLNRWCINTFGDLQVTEDYLYVLQLRSQNRWVKNYWTSVLQKSSNVKKNHIISPQEQLRLDLKNQEVLNMANSKYNLFNLNVNDNKSLLINNVKYPTIANKSFLLNDSLLNLNTNLKIKKSIWEATEASDYSYVLLNSTIEISDFINNTRSLNLSFKKYNMNTKSIINSILTNTSSNNIKLNMYSDFVESSRLLKRTQGVNLPLRLIKYPFGLENVYETNYNSDNKTLLNLFKVKFNDTENSLTYKSIPHTSYLTIKQKKYKKKKTIPAITKYYKDVEGNKTKKVRYSGKPILFNNTIFEEGAGDPTLLYRMIKKNKKRSETIPVNLAKRIIRTKRTLVLPAHVNITIITNSFDIVHSWFIPGLGIKLDCVPGRSTHHTFYIDNVGFYYGQCAEICGRYHHHMPIRVCALPFEHFLVWWYTFGLPKLLFTTSQKRFETYYSFRKYVW